MKKTSIWEIIAWLGLFLLGVWIVLKLLGVIQSPLVFEIAPEIALFLILGSLLADMKNLKFEIRKIGNSLSRLIPDFRQLKGEHEIIKKKVI